MVAWSRSPCGRVTLERSEVRTPAVRASGAEKEMREALATSETCGMRLQRPHAKSDATKALAPIEDFHIDSVQMF